MPAYVMGHIRVHDSSWEEAYKAKVPALIAKHGGRYLMRRGQAEILEGDMTLPTGFVLLEFPSMAKAREFYNDPEYAPMIKLRQSGSEVELALVEGL